MQAFTQLKIWQRGHLLAVRLYVLTQAFPAEERYGLSSQLRRAATSIPSNIAEGSKRPWPNEYSRFLNIAQGSAAEVEALLILARDIGLVSVERTAALLEEVDHVCGMLEALRQRVDRAGPKPLAARREAAGEAASPAEGQGLSTPNRVRSTPAAQHSTTGAR